VIRTVVLILMCLVTVRVDAAVLCPLRSGAVALRARCKPRQPAAADIVLCQTSSGALNVRAVCRRHETKIDPKRLGVCLAPSIIMPAEPEAVGAEICKLGDLCTRSTCKLVAAVDGGLRCSSGCTPGECHRDPDCPAGSWCSVTASCCSGCP
jgi:hypothetical protein